jgi:hypothetical protein
MTRTQFRLAMLALAIFVFGTYAAHWRKTHPLPSQPRPTPSVTHTHIPPATAAVPAPHSTKGTHR